MEGSKESKSESSDDRTSGSFGSLFKTNLKIQKAALRKKELPNRLSNEFVGIDEFVSTKKEESCRFTKVRLHSRLHFSQKKIRNADLSRKHLLIPPEEHPKSSSIDHVGDDAQNPQKNRRFDRELIAEMNRQYDHNVCLDRFINEIENQQQVEEPVKITNIEKSKSQTGLKQIFSTEAMSKIDRCNKCTGSSCGCPTFMNGTTVQIPQSNDVTYSSGSHTNRSIKSSLPENVSDMSAENVESTKEEDSSDAKSSLMFKPLYSGNTESTYSDKHPSEESGIELSSESAEDPFISPANANNYKGGKPGRKRKRGYIYDPKPVKEKLQRQDKTKIPDDSKDQDYWERRRRNNEAARKSREMRRKKELEVNGRLATLKKENDALRVAIGLLIKRNETLEFILTDYEIAERQKNGSEMALSVPVTS